MHAGLGEGITDEGLRALALAWCGSELTSLTLASLVSFFSLGGSVHGGIDRLFPLPSLVVTDLRSKVTDRALIALADAGCGRKLTSLTLSGDPASPRWT